MEHNKKAIYADDLLVAIRDDLSINSTSFAAIVRHINAAPAVELKPTEATPDIAGDAGTKDHGEG